MGQPLVSICISCYNHEQYVGEALKSALDQTYTNTEILISDDGSTDRSRDIILEIINQYPGKKIKTFFSESNTSFRVIEDMFSNVSGKYIAIFSADDCWGVTAVETYVEFMEQHEEYAVAFSKPTIILEDENAVVPGFLARNMSRYEWFHLLFKEGNRVCAPTTFVRSAVWKEMGGSWKWQYRQLQDYEMWLRILQKYEIYFFEKGEVPVFYRIHGNNLSGVTPESQQRDMIERIDIHSHIVEELEQDFFVKVFEDELVYPVGSEQFCLNCEKMMVLYHAPVVFPNSAITFYFTHIADEDFAKHIERDYHFTRKNLYKLTGTLMTIDEGKDKVLNEQFATIEKQKEIINDLIQKVEFLLNARKNDK